MWDSVSQNWNEIESTDEINFTATGCTYPVEYKFKVRANNSAGSSGWSNEITVKKSTAPGPPTGLTFLRATKSCLEFSWTEPNDNGGSA
jgi:hypothetical protein